MAEGGKDIVERIENAPRRFGGLIIFFGVANHHISSNEYVMSGVLVRVSMSVLYVIMTSFKM